MASRFPIACAAATALLGCALSLARAAESHLTVVPNPSGPKLMIQGPSGSWVQVQYRAALDRSARWQPLSFSQLNQGAGTVTDPSAASAPIRFYRIVEPIGSSPTSFLMGSPATEIGRDYDESPQTLVTLTLSFWMSDHEVTQGEYQAVMGANPSAAIGDPNRPVEQVTWDEAQTYCQQRTELERALSQIPSSLRYRLPTEAEWEYAARGGSTNRFSFGDDPGYVQLGQYAWFISNSDNLTHPVATKSPNRFGLYDMNGNVWEWCQDWYGAYPGGSQTNPAGPASGLERVVRGGSYYFDGWLCRSAARNSFPPNTRSPQVGFRVVLSPE